jgi:hypothetical protein
MANSRGAKRRGSEAGRNTGMSQFSEALLEHDGLRRLYHYWLQKKGDRRAPARRDIDPEEIVALLPNVYLVDVEGARFRLRLVGTAVVRDYGREITGQFLDQIDLDDHKAEILHEYEVAVSRLLPQYHRWDYKKDDGRFLRYERLILPLSSDSKVGDKLLCAAFVRPFKPDAL